MPNSAFRLPENAPGRFFIVDECIYCALCGNDVPDVFQPIDITDQHFVYRQPESPAEIDEVLRAIQRCPVDAIRDSDSEVS